MTPFSYCLCFREHYEYNNRNTDIFQNFIYRMFKTVGKSAIHNVFTGIPYLISFNLGKTRITMITYSYNSKHFLVTQSPI